MTGVARNVALGVGAIASLGVLLPRSAAHAEDVPPPAGHGDAAALSSQTPTASDDEGPWVHGSVRLRYDFRAARRSESLHRETDQDLTDDVFLEAGLGRHLRVELSGQTHADLDGHAVVSRFRDKNDVDDTWISGWCATAYVEGLELGPIARARFGRQYLAEGVDVRFDGGLVETAPFRGVKLAAYGGVPVDLWHSSALGDWLAGGAVEVVAIPRTNVRFDFTHVTELLNDLARERAFEGVPFDRLRDDNRFQLTIVNRPVDELRLFARASTFGGTSTRAEGEASLEPKESGFVGRVRYVAQLGAYRDLSLPYDPYTEQLGAYMPYHELLVDLRQTIAEVLALRAGGSVRKLLDRSDEGEFNHEFWRVFGGFDLTDSPLPGFQLSLLAEYYRGLTLGRSFQASGEASQEVVKGVRLGLGSQYAAFKLDSFFLVERENVRTYDAFVEWRPTKLLRFRVSYAYETSDEDRFHAVRFDARLHF